MLELYSANINDYYLYLHDTCKIGKDFYNKIKSIDLNNVSSIKINKRNSMNIGIYSQKIINEFKDFLLQKKNTDESKCMEFKSIDYNEDYIFDNDKNNILLNYYDGFIYTGPIDYYNTGTMRLVEYFPHLDLYKNNLLLYKWETHHLQPNIGCRITIGPKNCSAKVQWTPK